jgi:hypothetical protein
MLHLLFDDSGLVRRWQTEQAEVYFNVVRSNLHIKVGFIKGECGTTYVVRKNYRCGMRINDASVQADELHVESGIEFSQCSRTTS